MTYQNTNGTSLNNFSILNGMSPELQAYGKEMLFDVKFNLF